MSAPAGLSERSRPGFTQPPAWRIRKLRAFLVDVREQALRGEIIVPSEHRAARRIFEKACRRGATGAEDQGEPSSAALPNPLRNGAGKRRVFSDRLQDIIWREILRGRQNGETATAVWSAVAAACREAGERPPVLSTIHTRFWDACPENILNRLGQDDPDLPAGDSLEIGRRVHRFLTEAGIDGLEAPIVTRGRVSLPANRHWHPSIAIYEPAADLWWHVSPRWEPDYRVSAKIGSTTQYWGCAVSTSPDPSEGEDYERCLEPYSWPRLHCREIEREIGTKLLQLRDLALSMLRLPKSFDASSLLVEHLTPAAGSAEGERGAARLPIDHLAGVVISAARAAPACCGGVAGDPEGGIADQIMAGTTLRGAGDPEGGIADQFMAGAALGFAVARALGAPRTQADQIVAAFGLIGRLAGRA